MLSDPLDFDGALVAFAADLRAEGVTVGTSELLDAFSALELVSWGSVTEFRETLAATIAKSPDDRRLFALVFDRFFFREAELQAVRLEVSEPQVRVGDGGEVLDRAARQRPVQVAECPLRRQGLVALDLCPLELAPQRLLKAPQLIARDAVMARVIGGQFGLRFGAQPKRAADALHVDAQHARALALAEGGDRQAREVAQV